MKGDEATPQWGNRALSPMSYIVYFIYDKVFIGDFSWRIRLSEN